MMTAVEFIHAELKRLHGMLDKTVDGLTPEQLHAVPAGHPKANTIAWGLWHHTRTEDNVVRWVVQDRRPTVWMEGNYAERFGLPAVSQGTGMSTEEAQALRIRDIDLFRDYMQRVWASTDDLFATADPATFLRTVLVKPIGEITVVRALGQVVLSHGVSHFGQLELARTLVGAKPVIGV